MKTEIVNTTELNVGDIVHCHGGRFRLVECTHSAATAAERVAYAKKYDAQATAADMERIENLRAFNSEFIGDVIEGQRCSVPMSWRAEGWTVQGNHFARWAREVA